MGTVKKKALGSQKRFKNVYYHNLSKPLNEARALKSTFRCCSLRWSLWPCHKKDTRQKCVLKLKFNVSVNYKFMHLGFILSFIRHRMLSDVKYEIKFKLDIFFK